MKTLIRVFIILGAFSFSQVKAQNDIHLPPGTVIKYTPAKNGRYIGSPSISILPNGDYVASHDEFGPRTTEYRDGKTFVYTSSDKGKTWKFLSIVQGQFWSSLFTHKNELYIIGTNKHHGNYIIRRSIDNGKTWTIPYDKENGLLLEGEYHTAPVPTVIHNGRLWRSVEYATGKTAKWGERYSAAVMSCSVDEDLLKANNWTRTNHITYDSTYVNNTFRGWVEGNVVVDPKGNLLNIIRVDTPKGAEEKTAHIKVIDEKTVKFDRNDFVEMPGGAKKFTIRYDSKSKRYIALANYVPEEYKDKADPVRVRNTLALISSSNLKDWRIDETLLFNEDNTNHGFQYVDWLFEGNDIIYVCRTAFDDAEGGARNNHDANFLTFHRISNYKKLIKQ